MAIPPPAAGRLLVALLDLVWPPHCTVCGGPGWDGDGLCALCAARLPPPVPRCAGCGRAVGPFARQDPCARCEGSRGRLDAVVAAHTYTGVARELVLALKFRARVQAARALGRALAEAIHAAGIPGDLIVPVPLSRRRRRSRGFDQAVLLAAEVAARVPLTLDRHALRRHRDTPPQAGLPRGRRRRGPRGAFSARRSRVRGRSILLVDDVLTSGGTAHACASALRRAGARSIVAAVACRA